MNKFERLLDYMGYYVPALSDSEAHLHQLEWDILLDTAIQEELAEGRENQRRKRAERYRKPKQPKTSMSHTWFAQQFIRGNRF